MNLEALVKPVVQIGVGAALIMAMTFIAGAFSEPTFTPATGNAPPPINDGGAAQVKTGGLGILGNLVIGNSASVGTELPQFLQLDAVNSNATIPGTSGYLISDCDTTNDVGKMFYDVNTKYIYICDSPGAANPIDMWRRIVTSIP